MRLVRVLLVWLLLVACDRNEAPVVAAPAPMPAVVEALHLEVSLAASGITVQGAGRWFEPGCATRAAAPVVTIPRAASGQDYAGLTRCLARIKTDFPRERTVTLSVEEHIEYAQVVAAMDAMRYDGARELFPDVVLSPE